MAFIRRKGIWRPQAVPTFSVEVDWAHPLSAGLIGLWIPTHGGANLAKSPLVLAQPAGGLPPITATEIGPAWLQTTGGAGLLATAPAAFTSGSNFSVFWRGQIVGNLVGSYNCPIAGITYASSDTNPYVSYDIEITGGEQVYGRIGNSETAHVSAGTVSCSAGITIGSWGANLYYLGAFSSNVAATPTYSSTAQVVIGSYPGDQTRSSDIATNLAAFYNTADDSSSAGASKNMAWLAAEPFAMLRPVIRRTYGLPAASGITVTVLAPVASEWLTHGGGTVSVAIEDLASVAGIDAVPLEFLGNNPVSHVGRAIVSDAAIFLAAVVDAAIEPASVDDQAVGNAAVSDD